MSRFLYLQLVGLVIGAFSPAASAQKTAGRVPQQVLECERLANHPYDSHRRDRTVGVKFEQMDVAAATSACQLAVQSYPNSANLRQNLGRAFYNLKRYREALEQFLIAAQAGYPFSMINVGDMYFNGEGVPADRRIAVAWYRRAAEAGEPAAMGAMSAALWDGEYVKKDLAESAKWAQAGAKLGDPIAMNVLGLHYEEGRLLPQDRGVALHWFNAAAMKGNETAAKNLAWLRQRIDSEAESSRKVEPRRREVICVPIIVNDRHTGRQDCE